MYLHVQALSNFRFVFFNLTFFKSPFQYWCSNKSESLIGCYFAFHSNSPFPNQVHLTVLYLCFCFDLSSLFLSIASSHLLLEICQSLCNIAKRKDVNRGLEYNIHCLQDTIFSSYTFINLWCSVVAPRTFVLSSLRRICESAKLDGVRDDNFTFGQNSLTRSIFSDSSTLPEIHHLVFTLPYTLLLLWYILIYSIYHLFYI